MLDTIQQWDEKALVFFNNLGCEPFDEFWLYCSAEYTWLPMYFLLLLIILYSFSARKIIFILLGIALVVGLSDFLTASVFRPLIERLRPCHHEDLAMQLRLVRGSCGGKYGLWSAHASNSFALAVFLGNVLKSKYKIALFLFLIWASFVAYSRIYLGVHYFSDIIIGALFGSTIGYGIYRLYLKLA